LEALRIGLVVLCGGCCRCVNVDSLIIFNLVAHMWPFVLLCFHRYFLFNYFLLSTASSTCTIVECLLF
jgi:hypothetical protein